MAQRKKHFFCIIMCCLCHFYACLQAVYIEQQHIRHLEKAESRSRGYLFQCAPRQSSGKAVRKFPKCARPTGWGNYAAGWRKGEGRPVANQRLQTKQKNQGCVLLCMQFKSFYTQNSEFSTKLSPSELSCFHTMGRKWVLKPPRRCFCEFKQLVRGFLLCELCTTRSLNVTSHNGVRMNTSLLSDLETFF